MDGQMDLYMDGWMNVQTGRQTDGQRNRESSSYVSGEAPVAESMEAEWTAVTLW